MSNGLDSVGPDLGPYCLQLSSADDKIANSRQRLRMKLNHRRIDTTPFCYLFKFHFAEKFKINPLELIVETSFFTKPGPQI